jgi:hypothetical protein
MAGLLWGECTAIALIYTEFGVLQTIFGYGAIETVKDCREDWPPIAQAAIERH